ncbi:MAG: hypothetical protein VYA00_00265 [Thermoproteota archaeon]|nr:hypothetical protein [Thermoproteota archaeon]
MSVKQDALDELVTEQELMLMDMLKNWNDIRTRLANIEPNNPMNEMFDKMIQDLVKIQNHTKNYRTLLEKMKQIYDEFNKESKEWHEKYDKSAD